MTELVVERLKLVEVEDEQAKRLPRRLMPHDEPLAMRFEGVTVQRAGQQVGLRLQLLLAFRPLPAHGNDENCRHDRVQDEHKAERSEPVRLHGQRTERIWRESYQRYPAGEEYGKRSEQRDDRPSATATFPAGRARTRQLSWQAMSQAEATRALRGSPGSQRNLG
jgi:hypothetical protein